MGTVFRHKMARTLVPSRLIWIQGSNFELCISRTTRPILVKLGHKLHKISFFLLRQKKIEKIRKKIVPFLPSGRGEKTKRWVTSLTPPYHRQIRRGIVYHAFHKKHPLRSM